MFSSTLLAFSILAGTNAFVHNVQVSDHNGNLVYTPPVTTAKPGDFVNFIFSPKNHTVTQSSFDDPCTPLQNGFTSGFRPVAANLTTDFPVFTIPVLDSKPIWFHCEQGAGTNASHCGKGMVGAINTDESKFDQFKQKALAIGASLSGNSTSSPTVHQVSVSNANGNLTYTPPVTYAKPGEVVRFTFFPKNHTVSQSSFDSPCSPLDYGFTSGFHPVAPGSIGSETFDITVKDDKPIWFYCQQGANTNASHCGKGMVGAINPTADKTFQEFLQKALAVGAALNANSTIAPTVHQVSVSNTNGDLTYTPSVTYAKPGEIVRFTFFPKNHTVSQSAFDSPCSPLDYGFTSGFRPVAPGAASTETFDIVVKDDKPIWFYCQQGANTNASHCGKGMVGAINPTADKTFQEFLQKALAVGIALNANSTSAPTVHQVSVSNANGDLTYTPSVTYAKPGEIVRFTFFPKNHTVSQSAFDSPCSPLDYGFTSGFRPVAPGAVSTETFDIVVKDDKPIWFYCQQGANTNATHCGKGMVGAINPTADKTFAAFQQKALAVGAALNANASSAPVYHDVSVGGQDGSLVYTPSSVIAKKGDIVRFTFNPKNHSVTQSSFDEPCTKIQGAIDSGFHPVSPNTYGGPVIFTVPVIDDSPKWFYCAQGAGTNASHCGHGMVFALNPTADKTFAAFRSKALAVGQSLGVIAPIPL